MLKIAFFWGRGKGGGKGGGIYAQAFYSKNMYIIVR